MDGRGLPLSQGRRSGAPGGGRSCPMATAPCPCQERGAEGWWRAALGPPSGGAPPPSGRAATESSKWEKSHLVKKAARTERGGPGLHPPGLRRRCLSPSRQPPPFGFTRGGGGGGPAPNGPTGRSAGRTGSPEVRAFAPPAPPRPPPAAPFLHVGLLRVAGRATGRRARRGGGVGQRPRPRGRGRWGTHSGGLSHSGMNLQERHTRLRWNSIDVFSHTSNPLESIQVSLLS